jgi:hypothetical protein
MFKKLLIVFNFLIILTACARGNKHQIYSSQKQEELELRQVWEQNYPQYDFEGDFLWEISNNGIIITGYTGGKTEVRIPSKINGMSVVEIGKYAFADNKLTNITIPNSVTSIGAGAFMDNQLTTISIGANVEVDMEAFADNFAVFYNSQGCRQEHIPL